MKGLEPQRLSTLDPKSNAATNYATSAEGGAKIYFFVIGWWVFEKKPRIARIYTNNFILIIKK